MAIFRIATSVLTLAIVFCLAQYTFGQSSGKCDCRLGSSGPDLAAELLRSRGSRIIQGKEARVGQFPWQVSLQTLRSGRWQHVCGGVLISSRFVLTAKHCLLGFDAQDHRVLVGATRLNSKDGTQYLVKGIHVYNEEYPRVEFEHDIAVLELKSRGGSGGPVQCSKVVQPICLGRSGSGINNDRRKNVKACVVPGWGTTVGADTSLVSSKLMFAKVSVLDDVACNKSLNEGFDGDRFVESAMMCALGGGKQDACAGDSGGPLVCLDPVRRMPMLSGLVSWRAGACGASKPSAYVRIHKYLKWIRKKTGVELV